VSRVEGLGIGIAFRVEGWVFRTVGEDELGMAGWLRTDGRMRMRRWIPAYDLRG